MEPIKEGDVVLHGDNPNLYRVLGINPACGLASLVLDEYKDETGFKYRASQRAEYVKDLKKV